MPVTYKKIASVTVTGATQATIEFTSIPADYTDLIIKLSARTNRAATTDRFILGFNGLSTNRSSRWLVGDGSAAGSYSDATSIINDGSTGGNATASTFGNAEIYIPNYAGNTNKSVSSDGVGENNATGANSSLSAGLWSSTSAITSIQISAIGSYVTNSTAVLYGIKKN